jgi:malonate-semialdehyde dehydrogenase (acetylating)/methylmalonate-semialdehyde dehydrogenase
MASKLKNFINGQWRDSSATEYQPIRNPATQEVLADVPLSPAADVDAAVRAAAAAFPAWRRTVPQERIQYLFKLKQMLEERIEDIAKTITMENGKTMAESKAELRRAIENVEVACGIPTLMQGFNLEDIAPGIDEIMIRQPLGVVAAITPFNFPAMVPLWFLPYAIACGNTFVLKPSEKVPLTMGLITDLLAAIALPPGVVTVVNGGKAVVDALLDHPDVRAISFVGSTPVAKYIYARGAATGKRVQCQGGAKNHVVIMPDADQEMTAKIVSDGAFGCAGQRCLAVSVAVTVGQAHDRFCDAVSSLAKSISVGNGLDQSIGMGPVITAESKRRVEDLVNKGVQSGAKVLVDGRDARIEGYEKGNFIRPTIIESAKDDELAATEIFGPVLTVRRAASLEEAIALLSRSPYGNAASIFTTNGASARQFRYEASAGNIGINIGVAAPMAYFPFSGWKDSFLGVIHGQGSDAVEFYTEKKVVIERWPKEWSRKF